MNLGLNVIDLFSGCGGLSYGFEKAGYNVLLGIDNDKAALRTFKNNHRNSETSCVDITKVGKEQILEYIGKEKKIHAIVGGPPCQGMSLSGPRKLDDPRNKLYLSFIRIVEQIRPPAFIIENVPGLVSLFSGAIKDSITSRFTDLGYDVNYKIVCASDYGVPQSRKRVIFVGLRNVKFEFPEETNSIVTCEMAMSDLPPLEFETGIDESDYFTPPQNGYQKMMRKNSSKVYNHIAASHSERIREIISMVPDGCNYKCLPEEFRNTRNFHVAWTRFCSYKPAPTIDTGHRHHFHYKYNRVPTVRECARLQSFPDDFVFYGNKTEQFRQVGNAVPPLLAEQIAKKLADYLL